MKLCCEKVASTSFHVCMMLLSSFALLLLLITTLKHVMTKGLGQHDMQTAPSCCQQAVIITAQVGHIQIKVCLCIVGDQVYTCRDAQRVEMVLRNTVVRGNICVHPLGCGCWMLRLR